MAGSADGIYGPDAVPYGAEGMGIDQAYPVEDFGGPDGKPVATADELEEAGFAGRLREIDGHGVVYSVLHDEDGTIVATWDEGRWWTPEESEAWVATMLNSDVRHFARTVNELAGLPNRAARRRYRGGRG